MLRAHRKAHRLIWFAAAMAVPAILALGWLSRPVASTQAPERLSSPQDHR